VDCVFPAWTAYVEDMVRKIVETFSLTKEEKRQLLNSETR
jgi:hypothetical protein